MADSSWGMKRRCPSSSCDAVFYDFDRRPIVCPLCQAHFAPEDFLRNRRQRAVGRFDSEAKSEAAEDDLNTDSDDIDDFADDSLAEDESLENDMTDHP